MTHATHAGLSVLTLGLWVPVWVLCGALGWVVPTRCTLCGNQLRRVYSKWVTRGRTEYLCRHCAERAERDNSRRAWNGR